MAEELPRLERSGGGEVPATRPAVRYPGAKVWVHAPWRRRGSAVIAIGGGSRTRCDSGPAPGALVTGPARWEARQRGPCSRVSFFKGTLSVKGLGEEGVSGILTPRSAGIASCPRARTRRQRIRSTSALNPSAASPRAPIARGWVACDLLAWRRSRCYWPAATTPGAC